MGEQTKGEADLVDDLNEFVRQSSNLAADVPQTTGIRPHPVIEETEQTLDTSRFGFEFGPIPESESEPGSGGGPPTCACPLDTDTLSVVFDGIVNHGCVSFPGFGSFIVNGDPNTSYTLINDSPGHWQVEIDGIFTLDEYASGVDCTSFLGSESLKLFVVVACPGELGIVVSAYLVRGISVFCAVFHASDASPCATSFTNDFPLDGFFDFGTATLSII